MILSWGITLHESADFSLGRTIPPLRAPTPLLHRVVRRRPSRYGTGGVTCLLVTLRLTTAATDRLSPEDVFGVGADGWGATIG